jgi:hypothetical protein
MHLSAKADGNEIQKAAPKYFGTAFTFCLKNGSVFRLKTRIS